MGFGVSDAGLALPVFAYDHSLGCSVTGGTTPCRGFIPSGTIAVDGWGIRKNGSTWDNALLADTTLSISTFGEDESANVVPVPDRPGASGREKRTAGG